jgi:hypothetical protein
MPFDGSHFRFGLIDLFNEMLDFFGSDGERWTQGAQIGGDGSRCLVGALAACRAKLKMGKGDGAAQHLRWAIRYHTLWTRYSITGFNDADHTRFQDIRAVLILAKLSVTLCDERQLAFSFV